MSTTSLFGPKKFSPKKAPARKATTISPLQMSAAERSKEFGLDFSNAHLTLGNTHFAFNVDTAEWLNDEKSADYFENSASGQWQKRQNARGAGGLGNLISNMVPNSVVSSDKDKDKEVQKLQKSQQKTQEENNLLRIKNEILVDMIAEVYSEFKLETDANKKMNKKR